MGQEREKGVGKEERCKKGKVKRKGIRKMGQEREKGVGKEEGGRKGRTILERKRREQVRSV